MAILTIINLPTATVAQPVLPLPLGASDALVSHDTLLISCIVLTVVALAGIVSTISNRRAARAAGREARGRRKAMRELLSSMRLAESIAGIGVWQYDYATGDQDWSDGLKRMFGVDPEIEMVEGDAETLLCANYADLVGMIKLHSQEKEPFALQLEIDGLGGASRVISVEACNLRNNDGEVQRVVAVVRDVTVGEPCEGKDELGVGLQNVDPSSNPVPGKTAVCDEFDLLTGLASRRRVMRQLDGFVVEARSSALPLALVIFEIDHLKRIGENYGSPASDRVLQKVAQIALGLMRERDLIGRIAEDEFVWVIPGATEGMARVMTERIRQAVARDSAVGDVPPVTISLGISSMQPGDGALSLFARADNALCEAKRSGRNRVRVAA